MEENTFLYENVTDMVNLLMDVKDVTWNQAHELLHISDATHARWKKNDNTKKTTLQELFKQYSELFTPPLQEDVDLKNHRIINIALKNPVAQSIADRFIGTYYIYYYSDHYRNEIHGGMLKIYSQGGTSYAKIVIGIRDMDFLNNESFLNLFKTDCDSFNEFIRFKEVLKYYIDKRCYYYSGHVSIKENLLTLYLSGTEHRLDHSHIAMFDLQRISAGIDIGTGNIRSYNGGLGLVISLPNSQHRSIRSYRMGISRWKIDYDNPELQRLLKHSITDYERIIVTENDDRRWFDLMVLYEKQP